MVNFSFRFFAIGERSPSRIEDMYVTMARILRENQSLTGIWSTMKIYYPPDTVFEADFKQFTASLNQDKKLIRYILFKLEGENAENPYDPDSKEYTIEHILPQNPEGDWLDIFEDAKSRENMTNRLGNLCLMKAKQNRAIANLSYAEKRAIYQESDFKLTQKLATEDRYANWTPKAIADRQAQLAKQAKTIWRISQLD
jgi:hypothetical protein